MEKILDEKLLEDFEQKCDVTSPMVNFFHLNVAFSHYDGKLEADTKVECME